ncbi:MAG TPA: hypothetical protein VFD82_04910 [Planctomycetota bacterium]|nr:hypothetical protein [Planctomycetota bacterium]
MPRRPSGPSSGRKAAGPAQKPPQQPPQKSAPRPEARSPTPTGGARASSGFLASIGLATAFLAVFLLLRQRAFHGFDSDYYTLLVQSGDYGGLRQHVAFLPLVGLVFQAIHPLGFGAFDALLVTAALGSAVGLFCLHRAGRLLLGSGPAATALATGVALTPACFYFATAAEIHGVFAAGSGAAWWAFARWRNAPEQLARTAVLGVCCGLAGSIHSFGHLLMPMFAAIALTQDWLPRSHRVAHFSALAIAHLVVALAMAFALGAGASGQTNAAQQFATTWRETTEYGLAPATLWREAIVPFLPWSLIALLGMLRAGSRPWSSAFVIGAALHAPIVILLLSRPGSQFHEQGGYLLPMAVPAVLAAIAVMPRPVFWLATLLSAGLTAALVVPRWPRVYEPEFVAAVEQLSRERSLSLLVGSREIEGVRTHIDEGLICVDVNRTLAGFFGRSRASPQPVPLTEWFDAWIDRLVKKGDPLLVTAEARKCFEDSTDETVRNLWRDHVQHNYMVEPLQRPGLDGVLIRHR